MTKAAAEKTDSTPRYSWTKEEVREMTAVELTENLALVLARMVEIAPSL